MTLLVYEVDFAHHVVVNEVKRSDTWSECWTRGGHQKLTTLMMRRHFDRLARCEISTCNVLCDDYIHLSFILTLLA